MTWPKRKRLRHFLLEPLLILAFKKAAPLEDTGPLKDISHLWGIDNAT